MSDDDHVWVVLEHAPDGVSVAGVYDSEARANECASYMRCYYDTNHSKAHLWRWQVVESVIDVTTNDNAPSPGEGRGGVGVAGER